MNMLACSNCDPDVIENRFLYAIRRPDLDKVFLALLFLFLLVMSPGGFCADTAVHMVGSIDSRYKVAMIYQRNGNIIEGSYKYGTAGTPLKLRGTIDNSAKLVLNEFDAHGTMTGTFKGDLIDGKRIVGTWIKSNSKKALPFLLAREGDPSSLDGGKDGIIIVQQMKKVLRQPKEPGSDVVVRYPEVITAMLSNKELASKIEKTLSLNSVVGKSPDKMIAEVRGGDSSLMDVKYKVNYNRNYLVDADYTYSTMTAYPSDFTTHVLMNTKTGTTVRAKDIFITSSMKKLRSLISQRMQAEVQKTLKKFSDLAKEEFEIPETSKVTLDSMSVSDTGVTFLHDWGFRHVIECYQPDGRYFFSYRELKPFILKDGPLAVFMSP